MSRTGFGGQDPQPPVNRAVTELWWHSDRAGTSPYRPRVAKPGVAQHSFVLNASRAHTFALAQTSCHRREASRAWRHDNRERCIRWIETIIHRCGAPTDPCMRRRHVR
jgi:hypothetical protein